MTATAPPRRLCDDLDAEIGRLRGDGYRLRAIWPADSPAAALLERADDRLLLATSDDVALPDGRVPPFAPEFVLTREEDALGGMGRAGMCYRDLFPSRLGGHTIASHIRIPGAGPAGDWVHFHELAFQLIVVRRGSVTVAYQDQGPAFTMMPGDMVLQPPGIRHRVIESADDLEVVEVSVPAIHATFADHDLELPNSAEPRGGIYGGQAFVWHRSANAPWRPFAGGEAQESAVAGATLGKASARLVRPIQGGQLSFPAHDGELCFGFVMTGHAFLQLDGKTYSIASADAFAIPPGRVWTISRASDDFCLLQVATWKFD